jgi:predicted ABC-type ATPase
MGFLYITSVKCKEPGLYFGLANCPDFIFWLRNERQKSTLVRFIEPHGLHDEAENSVRSKAQCLFHPIELSGQEAFRKKGVELDGWILSATTKIADIPWAGKTTFATAFLPDFVHCREFLNADLIAAGLSPFAPETQNVRAGRLLLTRMRELIEGRGSFGFETTLSGRGYVRLFKRLRVNEYRIVLFFLWLPNADMAVSRVRARVRQDGHNVPAAVVRRRYKSGLLNALSLYKPFAHIWRMYDASHLPPKILAHEERGKIEVFDTPIYDRITKNMRTQSDE